MSLSPNGTVEVTMAAPRGLTPGEVLQALSFARCLAPLDPGYEGTVTLECLRDGETLRLDGAEAVTIETAEAFLMKLYNHSDRRGGVLREEVRSPRMPVTLREFEAWLTDRQPFGRDAKIEALALQVKENTKTCLWLRSELMYARKALDQLRAGERSSRARYPNRRPHGPPS